MTQKPVKVLLVEADANVARLVREQLTAAAAPEMSPEILEADSLERALKHLARSQRVDVIFLDLNLPDSEGLETFSRVRVRTPMPSIVILAEPAEETQAKEAVHKGAQDYVLQTEIEPRMMARVLRYACERRRSLDELRERREFSRLISQNVTDLIMVLDKEGRRLYHSPSYKSILGDLEFIKGTTALLEVHPEDRDSVNSVFRQTLLTGSGHRLEYRFLLKDGTVRFIESQPSVIRDRWGKPSKMVVVSRDITERKQAEQAMRESEQRYKHLLDSTTDYIFTVKVEGGRAVATTHRPGCEALTGYTPEDFQRSPHLWLAMVPADDQPAVLAQVRCLMRGEVPAPIEHRLIRKDGQLRWIRNTSVPRRDEQGVMVAYDGLISDITERKTAEERLKTAYAELARNDDALRQTLQDLNVSHETLKATQLQLIQAEKFESIGTLAAGVAHEVKNPLQTILMGLDYFRNNLPATDGNMRMALIDMRDAVKRADTIVRELLTLSAATHIDMKDGDFNSVVERSLFLVNYEVNAARIHAVRDLAASLPPVRMDGTRIEQVLINLFLNAIQAMPQGGTLTVRTRAEIWADGQPRGERASGQIAPGDLTVVAEVEDTGVGIPEQNLTKIFDPFFTTKPVGSGTGLGLSVAKQIIDLHGGIIDIKNAADGGVRVTVILKAKETAAP
jgi:PAS domain S-box-containing protein